ncbi:Glycosyl hydrolases family 2, TIM barrel domain-containing protein [Bifidobacterium avesanii]|nr:Glycosyl hydrolases family 2, TIM barrel domain-containing protein [Bifidobacterium avesanii]
MVHERRDPRTPNAYNTGYYPGGNYEYRRRFTVAEGDAERGMLLECEGAYPGALVTVNGRPAAEQHYGYGNFFVDLAPLVHAGENEITIAVDNTRLPNSRWYSGAGLYRPVWLWRGAGNAVAGNGTCMIRPDDVRVRTIAVERDGDGNVSASIGIRASVLGRGTGGDAATEPNLGGLRLRATIIPHDPSASSHRAHRGRHATVSVASASAPAPTPIEAEGPAGRELRVTVPSARLWSPDEPNLYLCRLTLLDPAIGAALDEHVERIGIRTLTCDARRGLRINGVRVPLNGGCVHHDNGILGAATWDQAEFRRARILKAAGFNAIRSAHNPLSKAFLDACDEVGLLVMDEAFDMWWMHKTSHDFAGRFRDDWDRELSAMVRKDRNHPCVVLYSIGNEIADTKSPRAAVMARRMVRRIRELDGTRPVIDCVNTISLMLAARTNAGPDEADPRVEGEPGLNTTLEHASGPALLTLIDRLMPLALRTGIMGRQTRGVFREVDVAGLNYCKQGPAYFHRRDPHRVFCASETYPQDIAYNWPAIKRLPYHIGDFVWTGWDYIGEASVSAWAYAGARDERGWAAQFGDRLGLSGIRTAPYRRYPALLGASGLIDITGHPTAQAYYRMVVTGALRRPVITVRPMTLLHGRHPSRRTLPSRLLDGTLNLLRLSGYDRRHGLNKTMRFIERGHDGVRSWSWPGFEERTAVVQVFSGGKSVRLLLNGRVVGEQPVWRCCAEFLLPYEPGELTAVALDADGREIARDAIRSAGPDARLAVTGAEWLESPYAEGPAAGGDAGMGRHRGGAIVYVDLALTDGGGEVRVADDRRLTVTLTDRARRAGVELLGAASANPITVDELASADGVAASCTTYFGRAQAVLRVPDAMPGTMSGALITVTAEGLPSVSWPHSDPQ